MYKRLYIFSFALFFVLLLVSIFIKLVLSVEAKFVIIDVIVLGLISFVFLTSYFIVYCRRNKLKRINEKVIPYILTNFVLLLFAIRLMPRFNSDKIFFGYFDSEFDYRLTPLYIVLLCIIFIQIVLAFIYTRVRSDYVKKIFLPKSYKIIIITAIFDIVAMFISFIVKIILSYNENIVDVMYLGCTVIWYLFYCGISIVLNKFKIPKRLVSYLSISVPIITILFSMGLMFFPPDFLQVKLQYIILSIINIIVLIIFFINAKNNQSKTIVFDNI